MLHVVWSRIELDHRICHCGVAIGKSQAVKPNMSGAKGYCGGPENAAEIRLQAVGCCRSFLNRENIEPGSSLARCLQEKTPEPDAPSLRNPRQGLFV